MSKTSQETELSRVLQVDVDKTKAELIAIGEHAANEIIESGMFDPMEVYARARQIKESLDAFIKTMNPSALDALYQEDEKKKRFGRVELSMANGRDTYDYEVDEVYADLNEKLKNRRKLLDMARKTTDPTYAKLPKVPLKTSGGTQLRLNYK